MLQITEKKYNEIHPDFRGVWTIERTDLPNWEDERVKYMGKRTMMHNDGGGACLLVEGIGFEIIPSTCIISSSHGNITIDSETGLILQVSLFNEPDTDMRFLNCITRFDVAEWVKTYNMPIPGSLDILDLGYWYNRIEDDQPDYEEPAHDWRQEKIEMSYQ